jgi:hypothetical protein
LISAFATSDIRLALRITTRIDEAFEIFGDKREFVVAVPRRHLVLAKFVSFDAGQQTSSELVPIINGTLAT